MQGTSLIPPASVLSQKRAVPAKTSLQCDASIEPLKSQLALNLKSLIPPPCSVSVKATRPSFGDAEHGIHAMALVPLAGEAPGLSRYTVQLLGVVSAYNSAYRVPVVNSYSERGFQLQMLHWDR